MKKIILSAIAIFAFGFVNALLLYLNVKLMTMNENNYRFYTNAIGVN